MVNRRNSMEMAGLIDQQENADNLQVNFMGKAF